MDLPIFTISLDYELHWGVFDKRHRHSRLQIYDNTNALVPKLLDLFDQYGIGVTWATVGSLFLRNYEDWLHHAPLQKPEYHDQKYSAYRFVEENGIDDLTEKAHFASKMVKLIDEYPNQELATHTFAHYYCLERGQDIEAFDADLKAVQKVSQDVVGKKMSSLVFPRNQFNRKYLEICYQNGITAIRSNPDSWYWTGIGNDDTTLSRKIFRTGDTFLPLGSKTYPLSAIKKVKGLPVAIPASRLLRQFDPKLKQLNRLRLNRIKSEMTAAAQKKHCYHLWWHPENFGEHPVECMAELEEILQHYSGLKSKYGMKSWAMREYVTNI